MSDPLVKFKKVKEMPSSIDDVIRLMDALQPNCQYYDRQKDGRGGCAKIRRGKLRKYAKAHDVQMGVKHWNQTGNWTPPNDKALSALMCIIRDMINKSWPLALKKEEVVESDEEEIAIPHDDASLKKEEVETDDEEITAPKNNKRQKLDVPTLTDAEKEVVLIQYKKDHPSEDAEEVLNEYLKFIYIKIKEDGGDCAPSKKVDDMWHAHILSTREYIAFCIRYNNNEYLHHNPALTNGYLLYKETLQKYKEYFGQEPNRRIWPQTFEFIEINRDEQDEDDGDEQEDDGDVEQGEDEEDEGDEQNEDEEDEGDVEQEEDDSIEQNGDDGDGDDDGDDGDDDDDDDDGDDPNNWGEYCRQWHRTYSETYEHHQNRVDGYYCGHRWINGEFNIECEDCLNSSMGISHDDDPFLESPFGRPFTCG